MRVLIVDDEELARRGIAKRLETADDVEVVGTCANGREAVAAIRELGPDLVFLDVQMPGLTGFDVLHAVGPDAVPAVIFVTAYDRHALRAFEVHALDYLLKPIDDDRFAQALDRARRHLEDRHERALGRRVSALLAAMPPSPEPASEDDGATRIEPTDRFVVKSGGRIFFVKSDEIDWVEAAADYVALHVGGATHLLRRTMTAMEADLDPGRFLRIHRSTIVNVDRIAELQPHVNGEYFVLLHDGTRLKMSRSYREPVQAFFGDAL